jgi:transcriptional regulator with XRE-family HTH domain
MIHSQQIRAGRAILNMSQLELAVITGLNISTIRKIEKNDQGLRSANFDSVNKIKEALEAKGVKFLNATESDNLSGIGVRLYSISSQD